MANSIDSCLKILCGLGRFKVRIYVYSLKHMYKIARWFHFELSRTPENKCAYSEIKFIMNTSFQCLYEYMTWGEMAEHEGRNK